MVDIPFNKIASKDRPQTKLYDINTRSSRSNLTEWFDPHFREIIHIWLISLYVLILVKSTELDYHYFFRPPSIASKGSIEVSFLIHSWIGWLHPFHDWIHPIFSYGKIFSLGKKSKFNFSGLFQFLLSIFQDY